MKIPTIKRHYFAIPGAPSGESSCNAATVEKACKRTDYPPDWHTRTEELPYDLAPVAVAVAENLPGEWTVEPASDEMQTSAMQLVRADGLTVYFNTADRGVRYYAFYSLPPRPSGPEGGTTYGWTVYKPGGGALAIPSVYVSAVKPAGTIAKEITRRLLPYCEEIHAAALQSIAEHSAAFNAQASVTAELAKAFGVETPAPDKTTFSIPPKPRNLDGGYGDVWVNAGGSVRIHLDSLPPARALKLAAFLSELFNS